MMRFLPLVLLLSIYGYAQKDLSGSRHSSYYTYVYKIGPEDAQRLARETLKNVRERYLYNLVDSFADHRPHKLPEGNYLLVSAENDQLRFEFFTSEIVTADLLSDNFDPRILIRTKAGKAVRSSAVSFRRKSLKYDETTGTYRLQNKKHSGQLDVVYQGVYHHFNISNERSRYTYHSRFISWFPIKQFRNLYHRLVTQRSSNTDFFYSTRFEKRYRGFLVYNKPQYKPGDSVKLKAFILTKKGRPIRQSLQLRLSDRLQSVDTVLDVVHPYRKGGYEFGFVLNDSVDLDLDNRYLITFEKRNKRKSDDDIEPERRKVLMRGQFAFEEYELQSVRFSARADKKEHYRKQQLAVYAKAVNENDLPVMDGRIQITVKPQAYGSKTFRDSHVFLPDTLWNYEQPLDHLGETQILVPDSIFPKADFGYTIECVFLNSDNERQIQTLYQVFHHQPGAVSFTEFSDSLRMDYTRLGKPATGEGLLLAFDKKGDTIEQRNVDLPSSLPVNPVVATYQILLEDTRSSYSFQKPLKAVSFSVSRTADSIRIVLDNPKKLKVWYTLRAGARIIQKGVTDSLLFQSRATSRKNYVLTWQYVYGGEAVNDILNIPLYDKFLSIAVDHPRIVYPGQQAVINIRVKDAKGKPVENADLTAYALTSKFENTSPTVPYLGKFQRLHWNNTRLQLLHAGLMDGTIKLKWERWAKEMKLDTIEYYKFLHPGKLYINTEPVADSITQVAPFAVRDGKPDPIHLIYIDEVPVYFDQVPGTPYSFKVKEGYHNFRLRTSSSLIRVDSLLIAARAKTFFSVDADTSNHRITQKRMPDTLTNTEKDLWTQYMVMVEPDGHPLRYLQQDGNYQLLTSITGPVLAGPFPRPWLDYNVIDKFSQSFTREGGYRFYIAQGFVKQKQLGHPYLFSSRLTTKAPQSLHERVLTYKRIRSKWEEYFTNQMIHADLFKNTVRQHDDKSRLVIEVMNEDDKPRVSSVLLFKYNDPSYIRIYKGSTRNFDGLPSDMYRMMLLFEDESYIIKDSIHLRSNGINFYSLRNLAGKRPDSVSMEIFKTIRARALAYVNNPDELQEITKHFNSAYYDLMWLTEVITGRVVDAAGEPVVAATIGVQGLNYSTVTDDHGYFSIRGLRDVTLVATAVGFSRQELKVRTMDANTIVLFEANSKLEEVVITAYGTTRRSEMTASISTVVQGRVAGLQVGNAGSAAAVMIRGTASIDAASPPFVIVDGVPVSMEEFEKMPPDAIQAVEVLEASAAVRLYGSKAVNGVIIVLSKKASLNNVVMDNGQPLPGNSLRKNFCDDAFWQPRLQTNSKGEASFQVTFPDDITNWRVHAIAVANGKRTGWVESSIKSYKPLAVTLALPQFLVAGDSFNMVGKTLNYLMDSTVATRSFYVNDRLVDSGFIRFRNSWIDRFGVTAHDTGSLKLKYAIAKPTGYFDGEEKAIPVFPPGVLETTGIFAALNRDTVFNISLKDSGESVLYAQTSILPILESEIESIRNYEYLCNEQLASKLKALLAQKKIDRYFNRPFRGAGNVYDIIQKLTDSKSTSGLWGWWKSGDVSHWISLHVVEALLEAKKEGYQVSLNTQTVIDYLVFTLEKSPRVSDLLALYLLKDLGAKAYFRKYIDAIDSTTKEWTLYQRLRLTELRQLNGLPVQLDSFISKKQTTLLGNSFWGEDKFEFFDNAIQNTVLMYRLIRRVDSTSSLLTSIQNFFLEKRRPGSWRNTYESSLIIETILPDILRKDSLPLEPVLTLSHGATARSIKQFPFTDTLRYGGQLTVSKSGRWPVYFTAYQRHWNSVPQKVSNNFTITSVFREQKRVMQTLKAGRPITLDITVQVDKDAEYVMVEIPIPAGCSYQSKPQPRSNGEVHREYFKNKVSIFCSSLARGSYTFSIDLLPRYTGSYTLNPARAELMYFPVFYGRNGMEKVRINE